MTAAELERWFAEVRCRREVAENRRGAVAIGVAVIVLTVAPLALTAALRLIGVLP